ncbi:sortase domain-containing protein [Kordiimonas laminariae]|uniref:sortase domain-containing protein n=1 Tax=Kordiimonas laminariae TaxID=2917717 RepID=UPI001FF2A18B|nr:sortase [Kordiimonas laminariae]
MKRSKRKTIMAGAALLTALGLWQLGGGAIIAAKAALAPVLVKSAWEESLKTGKPLKPWSWADTHPVAKLSLPDKGITHYVLAGDNMRALAFGPVMAEVSGTPIVFGHRDTHFAFLEHIEDGDILTFKTLDGAEESFRLTRAWVAHKDALSVPQESVEQILLVSCYPFRSVGETDRRIIMQAIKI